jgi:Ras-related protein Rab-11A
MERYRALNTMFYRQAAAAAMVFDLTNRATWEEVDSWLAEFQSHVTSECPVVLVGNKSDAIDSIDVDLDDVRRFAADRSLKFFQTSALSGDGVELMIEALVDMIPVRNNSVESTAITETKAEPDGCAC